MTLRRNRFGPLRVGCDGNNLKDRSAGVVISHNWIEGGNRKLDLVDAEDSVEIQDDPQYGKTVVYGNVLIERDQDGNNQIVHYGGDSGDIDIYRKGTLYFYNNTVVSRRRDSTTIFRLSSDDERAICWNNIFYTTSSGRYLALLDETGRVELTHNWFSRGWVNCHGTFRGRITGREDSLVGDNPGFVAANAAKYQLQRPSPCIASGLPISLVSTSSVSTQSGKRRKNPDLGAYRFKP